MDRLSTLLSGPSIFNNVYLLIELAKHADYPTFQTMRVASKPFDTFLKKNPMVAAEIERSFPVPRITDKCGTTEWMFNGELHREDGPAVEWDADGSKQWFVNGVQQRYVPAPKRRRL